MAKGDVSTPSSSRSLAHPTGNPNNKPLTSGDYPERSKHDKVLHHFALKPMALRRHQYQAQQAHQRWHAYADEPPR